VRIDVYVPLLLSTLFGVAAPWALCGLPPRAATWLLTGTATVAASAWATALALLGFTLVGQIPLVASEGPWSAGVLAANDPVHRSVALVCALLLLASVAGLTVASWRRVRVLVDGWREYRELPAAGDLAVVDDPVPTAFALPGMPGRIVVSSGMLQALSADERRALLAHERAHLRHRHHLFLLVLQLASAVHPLLRPLVREGAFTVERWADEEAAAEVADRSLVARAVARAALATKRAPRRALAAAGGPVPRRVQALLTPPAPFRRGPVVVCAALTLVCCVSLAEAAHDTERLFENAMHTSAATHEQPR
jgi:Zn-dependent protease with chaperone function